MEADGNPQSNIKQSSEILQKKERKVCRSQGGGGRIVGVREDKVITRKTTKSTYLGSQQLTETEPIIRESTWF